MGIRIQTQIVRVEGKDADHWTTTRLQATQLYGKFMVQNFPSVEILLSVRPTFSQKMNIFVVCLFIFGIGWTAIGFE